MVSLVIVGAGPIGAAIAHQAMAGSVARRVTLIDDAAEVARGLALDIRQAGAIAGSSSSVDGGDDLGAVVGAPVVIVADRHGAGEWQGDAGLAQVARLRALNPRALLICAGAAQAALVEGFVREHDGDRRRIVGSAPEGCRSALIALTCLEAGTAPGDVALAVIGRPSRELFVPWDGASVGGSRATDVLPAATLARLDRQMPLLWPPGPLTLAGAALRVARLVLGQAPGWACVTLVPPATADTQPGAVALPASYAAGSIQPEWPVLAPRDRVRLDAALAV